jgi:hypothetical protein
MRALWSKVKKHDFFRFLKIGKSFLDIFKMSIFEKPKFKNRKILHLLLHIFVNKHHLTNLFNNLIFPFFYVLVFASAHRFNKHFLVFVV